MQNGRSFAARVTFLANCLACTAFLTSSDANQVTQNTNYTLDQSMVTVTATFSSTDISLDAIIAIPQQFYDPVEVQDFLSSCANFQPM
jgi:hypothetical protein